MKKQQKIGEKQATKKDWELVIEKLVDKLVKTEIIIDNRLEKLEIELLKKEFEKEGVKIRLGTTCNDMLCIDNPKEKYGSGVYIHKSEGDWLEKARLWLKGYVTGK